MTFDVDRQEDEVSDCSSTLAWPLHMSAIKSQHVHTDQLMMFARLCAQPWQVVHRPESLHMNATNASAYTGKGDQVILSHAFPDPVIQNGLHVEWGGNDFSH